MPEGDGLAREERSPYRREIGKSGALLGRKGTETRARLLAVTRDLLSSVSPVDLTVAAIAKAARTAPATFYVYFDDVNDALYALSVEAGEEMLELAGRHSEWFTDPALLNEHARHFVDEFNRLWDIHKHVLQYRNLESDRGNARFRALRSVAAMPIIDRLAVAVCGAQPDLTAEESRADAIVLYSAVERLAATRYQYKDERAGTPSEELRAAQARVIALHLTSPARDARPG